MEGQLPESLLDYTSVELQYLAEEFFSAYIEQLYEDQDPKEKADEKNSDLELSRAKLLMLSVRSLFRRGSWKLLTFRSICQLKITTSMSST